METTTDKVLFVQQTGGPCGETEGGLDDMKNGDCISDMSCDDDHSNGTDEDADAEDAEDAQEKQDTADESSSEEEESWNDYNEKGPWHVPDGAALIVKQMAAEKIFWELVDSVVVDETLTADFQQLSYLIYEYPGLCHRKYVIQWDNENETRELYPLAILACLQPPSIELLEFVYQAFPPALSHKESAKGTMPFHYACTFGASLDVIDWMIQKDPSSVKTSRTDGMYPLHLAIFFKAPMDVVHRLLEIWPEAAEKEYDGEWSILHAAAAGQADLELVQRIYELNPDSVVSLDERSRTPLHQACWKRGNLPVIRFLVQHAPHVLQMEDDSSETPLFRASRNQSLDVIQYLLTAIAQQQTQPPPNEELDPLAHTANNTHTAAPFPPLDDLGATLLHFAALDNTEDVVQFLLQQHPEMATVQTRCRDRYTPLHSACHYSGGNGGGIAANSTAAAAATTTVVKQPNRKGGGGKQQHQRRSSNLANFQALVRHSPQLITMLNGDGKTPLETAQEVGSAADVIAFLQEITPPKVKNLRRMASQYDYQKEDSF